MPQPEWNRKAFGYFKREINGRHEYHVGRRNPCFVGLGASPKEAKTDSERQFNRWIRSMEKGLGEPIGWPTVDEIEKEGVLDLSDNPFTNPKGWKEDPRGFK